VLGGALVDAGVDLPVDLVGDGRFDGGGQGDRAGVVAAGHGDVERGGCVEVVAVDGGGQDAW
jgi:hypothetical protein